MACMHRYVAKHCKLEGRRKAAIRYSFQDQSTMERDALREVQAAWHDAKAAIRADSPAMFQWLAAFDRDW